jgi:hypothetical protein
VKPAPTRALLVAAFAATCALLAASGDAAAPKMHMHRATVGSPGKWQLAASTEGRFSVQLPVAFNDFTVESGDTEEVTRIFVVGGKSSDDFKFTAIRMVYRDGASAAERYFQRFCNDPIFGDELKERRRLKQEGREGVQLTAANARSWTAQRAIRLGSDLILMIVEAPADAAEKMPKLAGMFFDSLQVETETGDTQR